MEAAVKFADIFTKRIYIRLADQGDAFICNIQYGELYARRASYTIGPPGLEERETGHSHENENLMRSDLRKPPRGKA